MKDAIQKIEALIAINCLYNETVAPVDKEVINRLKKLKTCLSSATEADLPSVIMDINLVYNQFLPRLKEGYVITRDACKRYQCILDNYLIDYGPVDFLSTYRYVDVDQCLDIFSRYKELRSYVWQVESQKVFLDIRAMLHEEEVKKIQFISFTEDPLPIA